MTEKEVILSIITRLQKKVYYLGDDAVEFDGWGESIIVRFDENGTVTDIN